MGLQMKLRHRQLALRQGIKSICWTYDPLQSRNATLNLCRLGARVEEYLVDCYGQFGSRIERGLPSDRFVVNWRIATAAVTRRLEAGPPAPRQVRWPQVNETSLDPRGFLVNQDMHLQLRDRRLRVEIPTQSDHLRAKSLSLSRRWRLETRKIFQRYPSISRGFITSIITPTARY